MYFDFYDDRPDYLSHNRDIERLEGVLHLIVAVSVSFFFDIVALILLVVVASMPQTDAAKRAALAAAARSPEPTRFVFMSPRMNRPTKTAPPRAEASDMNRMAMAPERSQNPTNPLPYSRGNTFERVDELAAARAQRMARHEAPPSAEPPAVTPGQNGQNGSNGGLRLNGPASNTARPSGTGTPGMPGPLAAAIRNPSRYGGDVFDNPGGQGGQPGANIEFDSKGVDFGPWLRRFIAQVKRNWFIPEAAWAFKGHVVITFIVNRDGSLTELAVPGPSDITAFNNAAYGALVRSNPTQALPPEYPDDHCAFRVTFYYGEAPPIR
jgi:outer membrane biosynthesis protein TonB